MYLTHGTSPATRSFGGGGCHKAVVVDDVSRTRKMPLSVEEMDDGWIIPSLGDGMIESFGGTK